MSRIVSAVAAILGFVAACVLQVAAVKARLPPDTHPFLTSLSVVVCVLSLVKLWADHRKENKEKETRKESEKLNLSQHELTQEKINEGNKILKQIAGEKELYLDEAFPYGHLLFGPGQGRLKFVGRMQIEGKRAVEMDYHDVETTYVYDEGDAVVIIDGLTCRVLSKKGPNGRGQATFNNLWREPVIIPLVKGEVIKYGGPGINDGKEFLHGHIEVIVADKENPVFAFGLKSSNAKRNSYSHRDDAKRLKKLGLIDSRERRKGQGK